MKKFEIIPIILLCFILSSCREGYLSEKEFYWASKTLKRIEETSLPALGPQSLNIPIAAFEKIAEKYPGTPKAVESLFVVANLRLRQKDSESARAALAKVIQNYSGKGNWAADARMQTAKLYEVENNWDKAEETYWDLAEYEGLRQNALYAPIMILSHYKKVGNDPKKLRDAYLKAIGHYVSLRKDLGPINQSTAVTNYLALTYYTQDEFQPAREEWLSIVKDFPGSGYAPLALLAAAEAAWKQGSYDQALSEYEKFFESYPKSEIAGKIAVRLGLLYQERKNYEKARFWFSKVPSYLNKGESLQTAIPDSELLIAKAYQDEGNWADAEKKYDELVSKYPLSAAALQVPLIKNAYYQSATQVEKAQLILKDAVQYYEELQKKHPNTKVAAYAKRFMYAAFSQQGDWTAMLKNIEDEINLEKNADRRGRWMFLKAMVTQNRLKDKEQATALFNDFLTDYPEHSLSDLAKVFQEHAPQNNPPAGS